MTTHPPLLTSVPAEPEDDTSQCWLACQVVLAGPQKTAVRVLTPITGVPGGARIGVRVGRILLLVRDREALASLAAAVAQAGAHAQRAFGTGKD